MSQFNVGSLYSGDGDRILGSKCMGTLGILYPRHK